MAKSETSRSKHKPDFSRLGGRTGGIMKGAGTFSKPPAIKGEAYKIGAPSFSSRGK
jgi:hypothetical protein